MTKPLDSDSGGSLCILCSQCTVVYDHQSFGYAAHYIRWLRKHKLRWFCSECGSAIAEHFSANPDALPLTTRVCGTCDGSIGRIVPYTWIGTLRAEEMAGRVMCCCTELEQRAHYPTYCNSDASWHIQYPPRDDGTTYTAGQEAEETAWRAEASAMSAADFYERVADIAQSFDLAIHSSSASVREVNERHLTKYTKELMRLLNFRSFGHETAELKITEAIDWPGMPQLLSEEFYEERSALAWEALYELGVPDDCICPANNIALRHYHRCRIHPTELDLP